VLGRNRKSKISAGILSYQKAREQVILKIKSQEIGQKIGKIREHKVILALEHLKKHGIIKDYLQTAKLSFSDLMRGIDFYIIFVDDKYRSQAFSVTGLAWLDSHLEKHPEIPVLTISLKVILKNPQKKNIKAVI